MVDLSDGNMGLEWVSDNKIWDQFLNGRWVAIFNQIKYIPACQMVGSLCLVSSNSKKTLSGLMTCSLLNHAGNTSFFNMFSCEFLIDLAKNMEATKELTRPTTAEVTRNLPFQANLDSIKWPNFGTLLKALVIIKWYPVWEDGCAVADDAGNRLISLLDSADFGVVFGRQVVLVGVGLESVALLVYFFELDHFDWNFVIFFISI